MKITPKRANTLAQNFHIQYIWLHYNISSAVILLESHHRTKFSENFIQKRCVKTSDFSSIKSTSVLNSRNPHYTKLFTLQENNFATKRDLCCRKIFKPSTHGGTITHSWQSYPWAVIGSQQLYDNFIKFNNTSICFSVKKQL